MCVHAQGQEHSDSSMGTGEADGAVPPQGDGGGHESDAASTGGGGGPPAMDMASFTKMVRIGAKMQVV